MRNGQRTTEGGDGLRLALLAAGAFAVRLAYLLESRAASPFYAAPVVDARSYLDLAARIAAGDWLAAGVGESFWQPPGFPYLLALCTALFGPEPFTAIRVVHALLGAASVVLVYRIARPAFGRTAATLAATGTALYGPLVYFEGELLPVALEVCLYLALLLLLVRQASRPAAAGAVGIGLVAGLAAVTRPNILLFVGAVALVGLLRWVRAAPAERPHRGRLLLAAAAGLLLVLAPVTIRNAVVGGEFVLVSANGGVNFHIGNDALQDSLVAIHPGADWERLVAEPLAAGATTAGQRSAYFYRRGLASIAADPAGWLGRLTVKAWQLVEGPEIKRNQDIYYARRHSRLLSVLLWDHGLAFPHGLVAPLALLGLVVTWRRRDDATNTPWLFLARYAASVLLFFVTSRYRVPLVPVALVFAAAGACELAARLRARRWRDAALPVSALLILGVAVNLPQAPPVDQDAQLQHDLGEVLLRSDRFAESVRHSRRALALEPDYPSAWHNLAVGLLGLGQPREAAAAGHALQLYPARVDTRLVLARALLAAGDRAAALAELERAVGQAPEDGEVRYAAGRMLLQAGQAAAAVGHLQAAARLQPGSYWVRYDLGRALHASGQADAALAAFEGAARLAPARADALSAAGAVALARGDGERARDYLQRALAADADYLPARINLGLLEVSAGHFAAGIRWLEPIVERAPDPAPVRAALVRAYQATGQTQKARAAVEAARAR